MHTILAALRKLGSLLIPKQDPKMKVIYLNYFDQINDVKTKVLMATITEIIAKQKPDVLYFLFSSGGGYVNAGITLYNFLRALPVEVVMHNIGSIDSIATVIFLAGNKRYAAKHSTFLFHGIQTKFTAESFMSRTGLHEKLSGLTQDENKIAGIVAERSKLETKEIRELFHQGESKDLAFALEKGIIQEIRDAAIPKDAIVISFNLN